MNLSRCSILLLLLFALFCSYYDEDREDIPPADKRTVDFIVKYNGRSGIYPDYNVEVYIYYGIYSMDIAGFRYLPDGVLEYRGQEIAPDTALSVDRKEDVSPLLSDTKRVAVVVENSFYEGKMGTASYSSGDMSIKATSVFGGWCGDSRQPPECLSPSYDIQERGKVETSLLLYRGSICYKQSLCLVRIESLFCFCRASAFGRCLSHSFSEQPAPGALPGCIRGNCRLLRKNH